MIARRVRVAAWALLAVFSVSLVVVLTDSAPRVAASNTRVLASEKVVGLPPGRLICTGGEHVPRDADRVRVYVNTNDRPEGGPPLRLTVRRLHDGLAFTAMRGGGYRDGALDIRVPPRTADIEFARVCIRNLGAAGIELGGNFDPVSPEAPKAINGPYKDDRDYARMDWMRPGEESWMDIAPEMARRYTLLRPGFTGPWTMYLAVILMIAVAGAGVGVAMRAVTRG